MQIISLNEIILPQWGFYDQKKLQGFEDLTKKQLFVDSYALSNN